ncbi:hypothetical protein [Ferruginibacter sp.]|nr:hypothetical protein [Ferruginibacter sp.]
MKRLLAALSICFISLTNFAQNISTGVNNSAAGQAETNGWTVTNGSSTTTPFTVASYGSYWQPTPIQGCKARWINPTVSVGAQTPGFYVYERIINVPASGVKALTLNFQVSYDDVLTSLELVPPTGPAIPLTAVNPKPYYLSNQITTTQDVCGRTGNWKIRAKVQYIDVLGGFILCGNADLIKGDCCDCKKPTNTNVNFSLTTTLGGGTTATASAMGASTGLGNGWTLKEVSGGSSNPCKWVPGGIKWQSTGASIIIPAGVLLPGKCYVLTHYVNVCSTKWDPKACVVYKTICFCICDNTISTSPDTKPNTQGLQKRMPNSEEDEILKEAEQLSDAKGGRG